MLTVNTPFYGVKKLFATPPFFKQMRESRCRWEVYKGIWNPLPAGVMEQKKSFLFFRMERQYYKTKRNLKKGGWGSQYIETFSYLQKKWWGYGGANLNFYLL